MRLFCYVITLCALTPLLHLSAAVAIEDSDMLCEQVIVVFSLPLQRTACVDSFEPTIQVYHRMWLVQGERAWYAIRGPAVNDITVVLHRDGTRWLVWWWKDGKRAPLFCTNFPNTKEGRAQSRSLWKSLDVDGILARHGLDRLFGAGTSQVAPPVRAFNLFAFPPAVQSVYLQQTTFIDPNNSIRAAAFEWYTVCEGGSRVRLAYHLYADGRLVYQEYTTRLQKPRRGEEKLYPYLSAGTLRSYGKVSSKDFVQCIQSAGWGLYLTLTERTPSRGQQ